MVSKRPKGRAIYVPESVFGELDNIMQEDSLSSRSDAFRGMVQYSQIGREARRIRNIFGLSFTEEKKKSKRRRKR